MNEQKILENYANSMLRLETQCKEMTPTEWHEYHEKAKEEDEKWNGLRQDNGWRNW